MDGFKNLSMNETTQLICTFTFDAAITEMFHQQLISSMLISSNSGFISIPFKNRQDFWSSSSSSQNRTEMVAFNETNLDSNALSTLFSESPLQWILKLRFLFYLVWPSDTMFSSLEEVPRYVTEMFPVFFMVALLENAVRLWQGRNTIRINETIGSLSQGIFQECLRIKVRSIEVLMYCLVWQNFRLYSLPWDSLWTWWLCYLGVDIGFYWAHRWAHEVNFIWAIHQAHHSSDEFSIVSALRQAVLQPFTAWFTYIPLALIIPPQVFLAHLQLSELYMAWLHTEIVSTVGPLEYILNTPSHHRVHHSRNPEYIDKNYGGMLIIWDRLFGTFKKEDLNNPPVYGLVHPIKSFNPITIQFHTWPVIWRRIKTSKSLKHKLGVVLYGPGWRPGLDRLGDPRELPTIVRPVDAYNPQLSLWLSSYVVIHFGILLLFYHELTLFHNQFSSFNVNIGVISLLTSITSLGTMLDNKLKYNSLLELFRCLLFLQAKSSILTIFDQGLKRSGFGFQLRIFVTSTVYIIFVISVLINSTTLLTNYLSANSKKLCKIEKKLIAKIDKTRQ